MDRLCTHILGFDGRGRTEWFADCDQWLDWLAESVEQTTASGNAKAAKPAKTAKTTQATDAASPRPARPGKLSYLEQREYDAMEEKIAAAEAEHAALAEKMADPALTADAEALTECWRKQEALAAEIERLYQRWGELEEKQG